MYSNTDRLLRQNTLSEPILLVYRLMKIKHVSCRMRTMRSSSAKSTVLASAKNAG